MYRDFYEALAEFRRGPMGIRATRSFLRRWLPAVEQLAASLSPGSAARREAEAEASIALVRLAETLELSADDEQIDGLFDRAAELAYDSGSVDAIREALFCTGRWLHGRGHHALAAGYLRACLAQGRRGCDALECLGDCLSAEGGQTPAALWVYDWLSTMQPCVLDHHIGRATVELAVAPEAVRAQARGPEPDDLPTAARRIAALHALHRWQQAARAARAALEQAEMAGDSAWVLGFRSYLARYG